MDWFRLIILYGDFFAFTLIAFAVVSVLIIGRKNRFFMPRGLPAWLGFAASTVIFGAGALVLLLYLAAGLGGQRVMVRQLDAALGRPAPGLVYRSIEDGVPGGELADHAGLVVLVNVWATWCPPCVREMPDLERLQQEYSDAGLVVLHISDEEAETIRSFLETTPMSTIHGRVESIDELDGVFGRCRVRPVTFLIDRQGIVQRTFIGARSHAVFERGVRELL